VIVGSSKIARDLTERKRAVQNLRESEERFRLMANTAPVLIWMAGTDSDAHCLDPVPLAVLPPGNIYREHAIDKLERIGRNWKITCISASAVGLQAAAVAGMAVTVLGRSALTPGLREIGVNEGFPPLPAVDLLLYRAAGRNLAAIDALYNYLEIYLGSDSGRIAFDAETTGTPMRRVLPDAAE
jgi:DNA-binding transcriptional LysR family regulator